MPPSDHQPIRRTCGACTQQRAQASKSLFQNASLSSAITCMIAARSASSLLAMVPRPRL
jgi:hypothetical protein